MIRVTRQPEVYSIEVSGDDLDYLQGISSVAKEVAQVVYGKSDYGVSHWNKHVEPTEKMLLALNAAIIAGRGWKNA